jgi:hypothetical protein
MVINVKNIKEQTAILSGLIDQYELSYLNFYNVLNQESLVWRDGYSSRFFDISQSEKHEMEKQVLSLKQYIGIYGDATSKIEHLANQIKFNIEFRDSLYSYFNNYISCLNSIIDMYDGLDLSKNPELANTIYNEKAKIVEVRDSFVGIKSKYMGYINLLEEVDKELSVRLNGFSMPKINNYPKASIGV